MQTNRKSPTSRTSLKSKQIPRRSHNPRFLKRTTRKGINRFRYRHPCQRAKHLQRRANQATPNLKTRRRLQTTIRRIARLRPLVLRISENRLNRRGRSKKGRGKRASRLNSNKSQTKIRKRPTNPLSSPNN